jgi:geranylgeranyl diphosphate synthase type II
MRYSVFAGGKRIRPILCLASAEAVGADARQALVPALAIEVLHTYTLIHDDLPCMDNDNLRRGKPTAHVVFGEANALLAGDALLTLAFEWLASCPAPPSYPPGQLAAELAAAAGSREVIGGQVEDLAAESATPSAELVEFIHAHKTAALIRAAVRMGAIAGAADATALSTLTEYGNSVGLAFQITDDILNATAPPEALGKPAGSDERRRKMTSVSVHGLAGARKRAADLVKTAVDRVSALGRPAEPLAAIADYVAGRTR